MARLVRDISIFVKVLRWTLQRNGESTLLTGSTSSQNRMPISAAIAAVLGNQMSVDQAIESLLTRPIKAEG